MKALSVPMTHREILASVIYLPFSLFLLPSLLASIHLSLGGVWSEASLNFLYFLLNFLIVVAILFRFLTASAIDALKKPKQVLSSAFLGLAAYFAASSLLSQLVLWFIPDFSNVNDQSILQLTEQNALLMGIGTVFLVPLTEECLYRGLLFGALRNHSRAAAYLISVPVFCIIHILRYIGAYPPDTLLICFLQYIPAGLCIAWAYEQADNILAPILIHTAVNALSMIAPR